MNTPHPMATAFLSQPHGVRTGKEIGANGPRLPVISASEETAFAQVAARDATWIDLAVGAATAAMEGGWRDLLPDASARLPWGPAQAIVKQAKVFGQIDAPDTGKPTAKAIDASARWLTRNLRHFAGWADKIERASIPVTMAHRLTGARAEPISVCGLIVPQTGPLLMAMWILAPTLAAGNTVVLKRSEETPPSALYRTDLALRVVGLPPGGPNLVRGSGVAAGAARGPHPDIGKVGLTESAVTRRRVAASAAAMLMKPVTQELGARPRVWSLTRPVHGRAIGPGPAGWLSGRRQNHAGPIPMQLKLLAASANLVFDATWAGLPRPCTRRPNPSGKPEEMP